MLHAHVMDRADDVALEDAEIALDRVAVRVVRAAPPQSSELRAFSSASRLWFWRCRARRARSGGLQRPVRQQLHEDSSGPVSVLFGAGASPGQPHQARARRRFAILIPPAYVRRGKRASVVAVLILFRCQLLRNPYHGRRRSVRALGRNL